MGYPRREVRPEGATMPEEESARVLDPQRLLCVSSFEAGFGVDTLMTAFGLLAADRPDLQLDLVGEGRLEEALHTQARALSLQDRVHFHGRVPAQAACASSALVLPRHVEPQGPAPTSTGMVDVLTGTSAAPTLRSCLGRPLGGRRPPSSPLGSAEGPGGLGLGPLAGLDGLGRGPPRSRGPRPPARPPGPPTRPRRLLPGA